MKHARGEVQAADRDRDGVLNRDETFKYFYGSLCLKFLSRKSAKNNRPEVTRHGQAQPTECCIE